MEITYEDFVEFVGPVPREDLDFIDAFIGKDIFVSYPNGGIVDFSVQAHSHANYEFAIMSHHNTYLEYKDQLLSLKPGELLAISPGTVHKEVALDFQSRYLVISMKKEYFTRKMKEAGGSSFDFGLDFFKGIDDLVPYIEDFISTVKESQRLNDEILILEEIISGKIIDAILAKSTYDLNHVVDKNLKHAIEYMLENINKDLSLEIITDQTPYTKTTFSSKFKEAFGYSPMAHLKSIRIQKGKSLLFNSDLKIKDVALECGFKDLAHFSKSFKEEVGLSPKQFQKKMN